MAPEPALGKKLFEFAGERYHATDYAPDIWSGHGYMVRSLDLCSDLVKLPSRSFDLIIHNHVLEHIPCSVDVALKGLHRLLDGDGVHIFSVPFRGQRTDEDLSIVNPDVRKARFGQVDHMRIFGRDDFPQKIRNYGISRIEPFDLLTPKVLEVSAVPISPGRIDGNTLFMQKRLD
jgi:hypothetical protein